jgi:hypothetical protein
MSKINVADYGFEVSDFSASNDSRPYFQWFNPSSRNFGIAIDKKIADTINFKTDENWKLEDVRLKGEDDSKITGQMWFTRTPRMILLNGYPYAKVSNEINENSDPLFMFDKQTKKVVIYNGDNYKENKSNFDLFFVLVALFVDKDNNLLSETPLIFRTKGKAKSLFKEKYKEFIDENLKQFQVLTGLNLPKQTPTCKFLSRFIFTPTLIEGEVTGGNGMSSEATIVKSYQSLDKDNFTNLVLPKGHATLDYALSLLPDLTNYIYSSADSNTGEVRLTSEELEELKKIDLDF